MSFTPKAVPPNTLYYGDKCLKGMHDFLGGSDMMAYLSMLAPRLIELRRVLKPTGSLYLHCDPTASRYLNPNNWTFLGSDAGGKTAAIHFSLIASCQRHEVNLFEYLMDVLDRIASTPISKLADLQPRRWKPKTEMLPAN